MPGEDPETYYFSTRQWQELSGWQRQLVLLRNTFAGRLLLAPAVDIAQLLVNMGRALGEKAGAARGMWLVHGTLLAGMFTLMTHYAFPVWYYLLAISYPALALTKIRSFFEHRAADDPLARSVINEASLPWRLLFLNLNYHSVHHDLPGVPWYGLRKIYLLYKEDYQQRNQGFVVRGYGQWLRQFFIRPVDVGLHPQAAAENGSKEPHD